MFVVVEQDQESGANLVSQVFEPFADEAAAQAFADAKQDVQDNDDGYFMYVVIETTKPDIP